MKPTLIFVFINIIISAVSAQQTLFLNDPQAAFKQAKEYYQKEFYSLAYPIFRDLLADVKESDKTDNELNYQEIRYYTLVCGLKQNDSSSVDPAREFIEFENNKARAQMMSYHLAEYYFRKQDYATATGLYEKTSIENLS